MNIKTQIKNKDLKSYAQYMNKPIIAAGADALNIIKKYSPVFYTAGVYGWNADIYIFNDFILAAGYRPPTGSTVPYKIIEKYSTGKNSTGDHTRAFLNAIKKEFNITGGTK